MKDYKTIITNLEKLRTNYGVEISEIDDFAKLKSDTYKKILAGKKILNVVELIAILNIFEIDPSKIFNPNMRMPIFNQLPDLIKDIASERLGKKAKIIEKKDLIKYCILIIAKNIKVNDEFTNSQIKAHFDTDLAKKFKGKSIEWNKSSLSPYVEDTGETLPGKTKPEKVYKLVKKIPEEMVSIAMEVVGYDDKLE